MERLELKTIENIINTHKTVVEAFENSKIKDEDYCSTLDKCIIRGMEELKQYRIAEEQGLLLRLPCKVGDTVYKLWYANNIPYKVQAVTLRTLYGIVAMMEDGTFGKTVFLTKEEAEEALLRMENDNG